ncbi:MAG TPA: hypothetical protein VFX59_11850 [Polyangiales bacterium]|nr:hypothetical protein [Polyangiales bacterium]
MRRSWILLGALAACEDGQTGSPTSDMRPADLDASVTITCTTGPDASTALGVRGVELWDAFEGTYTLPANRPTRKNSLEAASFTVTVARSQEKVPGLDDCTRVAVPVQVTVQSANPPLNESVIGVLRGSLYSADVAFATPEYLSGTESRVYGSLIFNRGHALQLRMRTDEDATWVAPPLQEVE